MLLKCFKVSVIIGAEMKVISNNKKAFFDFFVSDLVEAGIVLEGCEVKSVRAGGVNLKDSFVVIKGGELFLKNAYIKTYDKTKDFKPDERRSRKLLLNKSEIQKLERQVREKGFSIVPTKIYINDKGRVKIAFHSIFVFCYANKGKRKKAI